MMLLLLFTYCTVLLHCAIGYRTTLNNDPRNDQGLFQGNQAAAALVRSPRQNRFNAPGNNFLQFPENENSRRFNGGFNWFNNGNNFDSNNKFNNNNRRPLRQSDIIFVDEDYDLNDVFVPNIPTTSTTTRRTPSPTVPVPGMGTTRSACEGNCRATTQFDPVCGDNNVTYTNINWLKCAQKCGRNVNVQYPGACPRIG